jgi:triacylglycerol lipase
MTALGLVATVRPSSQEPTTLEVQFEETLASERRFWLRGRITDPCFDNPPPPWWKIWDRQAAPTPARPTVHIETRISGHVFQTEAAVEADGRFEAQLTADLPAARRGWRIARNQVTHQGRTTEKCSVVLMPSAGASSAVLVVLPILHTGSARDLQGLAGSEAATQVTSTLRRIWKQGAEPTVYYLASVAVRSGLRQSELALATANLGWPTGHHLLMPAEPGMAAAALTHAVDRLRWLFAGILPVDILNLEPELTSELEARTAAENELAPIRQFINPQDSTGTSATRPYASLLRPTRAQLTPRYPVVFCHGLLAFTRLKMQLREDFNCFSPLRRFFHERGLCALFPQVAPTASVKERAQQLRDQIVSWTDEPVNLVAHSMGGLDARYLITHLGMADRVRSLTTVSTPHRGTYLADWFLANFRQRVPLLLAMEAMGVNVDGFDDCRPDACRDFNSCTPDLDGVRYFSYGGSVSAAHVTPFLRRAWNLLAAVEGPNDGMVSMASAHWGEYLGTIHADHFAQTPDLTFVRPGESFDPLDFYVRLIQDLARRGL